MRCALYVAYQSSVYALKVGAFGFGIGAVSFTNSPRRSDCRRLVIPARRYVYENRAEHIGYYEYMLFIYDTTDYSLIDKRQIDNPEQYRWKFSIDIEQFLGMHPDKH